jgi:hypothetical protein
LISSETRESNWAAALPEDTVTLALASKTVDAEDVVVVPERILEDEEVGEVELLLSAKAITVDCVGEVIV